MNDTDSSGYGLERPEKFAASEKEIRARHEANRLGWNEGAAHEYTPNVDAAIEFIRQGKSNLHPIERIYLGTILPGCDLAIHLQCASGKDTLSLLNEGVKRVVGVDISDEHIGNARRTSAALNAPAEWHRCDVLDTPASLDGTADLVYTGRGAICWLQDLDGWANVIYRLLKPGGYFSVLDDHPATWLFDQESETYVWSGVDYFHHCSSGVGWSEGYIGDIGIPLEQQSRTYECLWPIASVFQALTRAGLAVVHLGEHPEPYWDVYPRLKPELLGKVPLTFSILARKKGLGA